MCFKNLFYKNKKIQESVYVVKMATRVSFNTTARGGHQEKKNILLSHFVLKTLPHSWQGVAC